MRIRFVPVAATALAAACALQSTPALAWDYEGHRVVNEVALASLPADFPAFVKEPLNAERIAWLCTEPDRWRSSPDLPTRHLNAVDHYINLEQLPRAGLTPETISSFRYEFALQFAAARVSHREQFPESEAGKDPDHTRGWIGFLPWTITEYFGKLRGDFARLKVLEDEKLGTAAEIAQTKASICELMGIMGHYVGDGSQPLHTTDHHNGWVGDNPHGYTTSKGFHSWIDSGFINRAGITSADVGSRIKPVEPFALPAPVNERDPMFAHVMNYLVAQHGFVEPLYQLDKQGALRSAVASSSIEGREFIVQRLLSGGEMLGRIWVTAWRTAAPDSFLRGQLLRKQAAAAAVHSAESAK